MKVTYDKEQYNPANDMIRMVEIINRNFLSDKIEYFIMDTYTLSQLEHYSFKDSGYIKEKNFRPYFYGIPIATVQDIKGETERFVTVVHGYGEIEK